MTHNATNGTPQPGSNGTTHEPSQDTIGQQQGNVEASGQTEPETTDETLIVEIGPDGQQLPPGQPGGQQPGEIDTPASHPDIVAEQPESTKTAEPAKASCGEGRAAQPTVIFAIGPNEGFNTPPPRETREDLALIKRALKGGWKVPEVTGEALPRGLLEMFAATNTPAPGKPIPKGPSKYAYAPEHRLQAAGHLIRMNEDNMKADLVDAESGGMGDEIDIMTQTRRAEQLRRERCLVIDSDYIDGVINDAKGEGDGTETNERRTG